MANPESEDGSSNLDESRDDLVRSLNDLVDEIFDSLSGGPVRIVGALLHNSDCRGFTT